MNVKALYSVVLAVGLIGTTVNVASAAATGGAVVSRSVGTDIKGELKKWHTITLQFDGPLVSETDSKNPFTDYRLNVTFKNGNKTLIVPGFYAADGNAAETSATSGDKWEVRFAPPKTGTWTYEASFRTGTNVAASLNANAGSPVSSVDGKTGSFSVTTTDKTGRDLRGKGHLDYVGEHYLRFAGNGEVFLKAGSDAPENLLAYDDFDATLRGQDCHVSDWGKLKNWSHHRRDYDAASAGEYTWKNGKGSELLGAVKYLADQGMNAFSFLTFSLDGDSDNVYPHLQKVAGKTDWNGGVYHNRFDISKMEQWERIFSYGDKMGMYLHFKLQETENEMLMDGGAVGVERKIYLREMIARFGHHLALNWNIGEENDNQSDDQRRQMAKYILDVDPYDSNIVLHSSTGMRWQERVFVPLLGDKSVLMGTSLQTYPDDVHSDTLRWRKDSAKAGRKWVVANDEQAPGPSGDGDSNDNRKEMRHKVLWGNLMAGGAGIEYFYGGDLFVDNYRYIETKWNDAKSALDFFNKYLPFADMDPMDNITPYNADYVFGKAGEVYAVYLPEGGTHSINLPNGNYSVQWYNPRTGGNMTAKTSINNSISAPNSNDWVAFVTNDSVTIVPTNGDDTTTPPVGDVAVTSVSISGSAVTLTSAGATKLLVATVAPSNATDTAISWSSSNTAVATVNSNGKVKAVTDGTAVITATSVNGKKDTISVTVDIPTTDDPNDPNDPNDPGTGGGETLTLNPTHDAYLESGRRFNTNDLRVEAGRRVTYLQFDLGDAVDSLTSMELALTVGSDAGRGTVKIFQGDSSSWNERNLTKVNAPAAGTVLADINGDFPRGKKVTFDVSKAVISGLKVSFVVTMNKGGNDVSFVSGEAGTKAPVLTVKTGATVDAPVPDGGMPEFGSTISIKAKANDKLICADKVIDPASGSVFANRTVVGLWEKFTFEDAGNGFVVLKAHATDNYLVASQVSPYKLTADGVKVTNAAKFKWIGNDDETFSFKSKATGKFITANRALDGEEYPLTADSDAVGNLEKFIWGVE